MLKLFIEEGCDIKRELYVGMAVDRKAGKPVFMASPEGGVEIEQVASKTPELIFKEEVDPDAGLHPFQARRLAQKLGITGKLLGKTAAFDRLKGLLTGEASKIPYCELAGELGMNEGTVRLTVHRLRRRFGQYIREEIAKTVATPEEVDDELRSLLAALN